MSSYNPIWDHCHHLSITDLVAEKPQKRGVIYLKTTDTVEKAIKTFSDHQILSVPVVTSEGQVEIAGLVDMLDIAHFLLKVVPDGHQVSAEELTSLKMAGRAMAWAPLQEVMGTSGRDPPCPVHLENRVSLLVELFAKGFHRVPLFDKLEQQVTGLVSQSDLIRHLAPEILRGELKQVGQQTLVSLGLGQGQDLQLAPVDQITILQLIRQIDTSGCSSIGLINSDNELVGNFSATDLRGLWTETFPHFVLTARQYLENHHPASLQLTSLPLEGTTLTDVIQLLATKKIHRVWLVSDKKPMGVISLTDIMKIIRDFRMMV